MREGSNDIKGMEPNENHIDSNITVESTRFYGPLLLQDTSDKVDPLFL
jgi:hypothetical protein